ncbi:MAG TPA: ArnT family glycosyltransferase [Candidatus Tripitaka californicus]|uniref:ArnT family glycosyltransferase n=1 Tax=Candidatus Tripitaka californicus TaxID=3367616 RepID=UPI004025A322
MRDSHRVLLLSSLCLVLYLPALGNRDLWGTVETEYAQVAREALHSTSWGWLVPHFNGGLYNEKPPLYFWLMALASLPVGDVTEFTARLPSALAALGTVIVVYFLGKALLNERAGLLAALILLSSPGFFRSACMVRIDVPVAFFFTLSLASFYIGLATSRRWLFLLGWFSAALSCLVKGPVYPLIIVLTLSSYMVFRKELHRLKETLPLLGALVFFGTICLWLVPVYFKAGPYLNGLFNWGVWYLKEEEYHVESFYFYLPQFLVSMAPWSIFIPLVLYSYYKETRDREQGTGDRGQGIGKPLSPLPVLWLLVGLIAFSLLSTKHGRYILFIYPAGALMVAQMWEGYWAKSPPLWSWQKCLPVLVIAALTGVAVALFEGGRLPDPALGLSLVVAGMLIAVYLAYRASQVKLLFGVILLVLSVYQAIYCQFLLPLQNNANSDRPLCQKLLGIMEPGAKWAVYKYYRPSFTYYTHTFPGSIYMEEQFTALLSSREKVYCLLGEADYRGLGASVYKVAEIPNPREKGPPSFVLVSNRP